MIPTPESLVVNPSGMIALGDGYMRGMVNDPTPVPALLPSASLERNPFNAVLDAPLKDHAARRHRGNLNMSFCDGHVEDGSIHKWYYSEAENDVRLWRLDNQPKKN